MREAVALDVPDEPMPADELVDHLRRAVLDNSLKSGHPAHLAYITGTGTVPGAAADLLASGLNANVGGWLLSPAATEIELQLTRWLAARLGLPETAGGMIAAGGGVANFIALKVARDAMAGLDTRKNGVSAPLAIYCSEEAHVTIDRAADMLGPRHGLGPSRGARRPRSGHPARPARDRRRHRRHDCDGCGRASRGACGHRGKA